MKIKENEKRDKYLDLAGEQKMLLDMKVTVIPIVIGALGITPKGLGKWMELLEVGGRAETIQITTLRSTRILRRVQETCCHSNPSERPLV